MLVNMDGLVTMNELILHDGNTDRATAFLALEIGYSKARLRDEEQKNNGQTSESVVE